MTFTYTASPGHTSPEKRRDAVRLLISDTLESEALLQDDAIDFSISETSNDVYKAAAMCCRMLAARFSSIADTEVDGMKQSYWKTRDAYMRLATQLEASSTRFSSGGIGAPLAGGLTVQEFEEARDDKNRVQPFFQINQFDNPPFHSEKSDTVRD
jgi:hypothetical protein